MMSQVLDFDVRDVVLSDGTFGPQEIRKILNAVSHDATRLGVLRDAVADLECREDHTPASLVRLGVCQYLLGRYETAIKSLSRADGGALRPFLLGAVPAEPGADATGRVEFRGGARRATMRVSAVWGLRSPIGRVAMRPHP